MSTWSYLMFFFQQKTAYEMRISDWSSDVCSSDLAPFGVGGGREAHPFRNPPFDLGTAIAAVEMIANDRFQGRPLLLGVGNCNLIQIGRASCRERVCQYV